jgi:hydrogenase/urease accessory protein HupE
MILTGRQRTALRVVAILSFVVTNGVFLYWLIFRSRDLVAGLLHPAALVFELDVLVVLGLLAAYFRNHPLGPWSWRTFVLLSFIGGLGFSIPAFVLLNSPPRKASQM